MNKTTIILIVTLSSAALLVATEDRRTQPKSSASALTNCTEIIENFSVCTQQKGDNHE